MGVVGIEICYHITGATTVSHFADTFRLGKLSDGKYEIHFTGYLSKDTNTCDIHLDSTKYLDSLTVQPPENISAITSLLPVVYPNPVQEELHISLPYATKSGTVEIRDMQGRLVQQYDSVNTLLDVSALHAGIYLLYIETTKGRIISKILKE